MKVKKEGSKEFVWDPIRQKWVTLTPEEKVRQSVLEYLTERVGIPSNLISVEYSFSKIQPGNLKKVDILTWKHSDDGGLAPWLLVECKAPTVPLSEKLISQVTEYLGVCPCPYILLTNGVTSRYYQRKKAEYQRIPSLPFFSSST